MTTCANCAAFRGDWVSDSVYEIGDDGMGRCMMKTTAEHEFMESDGHPVRLFIPTPKRFDAEPCELFEGPVRLYHTEDK